MTLRLRRLSRENADRLAAGKPMKMLRGRLGIWRPGDPELPLQDIHPARYRSEEVEGKSLMSLCIGMPWRSRLIHIPNGGGRPAKIRTRKDGTTVRFSVEAASLKAQGLKEGVSDYLLAQPTKWHHGLWVELKASDGSRTDEQESWIEDMISQGYAGCFAYGADAAFDAIRLYLSGKWIW